ncbi:MAG: cupin domain-containing protein [Bacteroidales bacterium]|nr:cupin domain-containing protein [Bacteroidales bacterium]
MIKVISEGDNYKAINIGNLNQLSDYSFVHPKLGHTVENKLFIGELLKASGSEISFMELPAKTTINFLHKHKKHEEIYIFLKGTGQYQVDNDIFRITEGSIVRVSTNGSRTLSNDSESGMIYIVIQSTENSLTGYNISDGYRIDGEIKI